MIRFAWLQFRMQAAIAAGALAIVAVVLAVTGPNLVHLYDTTVAACGAHHDCSDATTAFTDTDGPLQVFPDFLVLLVPLLIGMFWGAPLVSREFETAGRGALASRLTAGLLSLMVTWWSSDLDLVSADPFNPLGFGIRDLVPAGYAAFAFTLGATAGLFSRSRAPAVELTRLAPGIQRVALPGRCFVPAAPGGAATTARPRRDLPVGHRHRGRNPGHRRRPRRHRTAGGPGRETLLARGPA
jgi:hypothetical protein